MTYDWECPRCGESRSAFSGCRCAGPGRCVWCGNYPDGYPPCRCEPPCEECGEVDCTCDRDLDAEDEAEVTRATALEPLCDDDFADRKERRREREAQLDAECAAMTPAEKERDGA